MLARGRANEEEDEKKKVDGVREGGGEGGSCSRRPGKKKDVEQHKTVLSLPFFLQRASGVLSSSQATLPLRLCLLLFLFLKQRTELSP